MSKSPPLKPLTTLSGRSYTGLSTPKDDADNLTFQSAMRRIQVCMLGAESLSQPLTEEQRDELYGRTLSELGSGRLGATVRRLSSDKSGASIEPSVWTAIPQGQFRKMTIDGRLPQKGYGQLYFSRRSVAAFETRIRNAAPYHFEYDRPRWRLFDACIWVATGGQQTSREQVADEDLWDQGAAKLFEALALQPSDGSGLCVSGISQSSGRRLELMPGEWDLAHTGWRELGNLVLFAQSNDPIRGSYITADFTPLRLPDPTYIELEIERVAPKPYSFAIFFAPGPVRRCIGNPLIAHIGNVQPVMSYIPLRDGLLLKSGPPVPALFCVAGQMC